MKRGKPLKRTSLKRGTSELKRTEMKRSTKPLPKMSAKAKKKIPGRRAAMKVVRERDQVCQFWLRLIVWAQKSGAVYFPNRSGVDGEFLLAKAKEKFPVNVPDCFGPLEGHEPIKRSHGADIEDPDQIVLLCQGHNQWVENFPIQRKLLDL